MKPSTQGIALITGASSGIGAVYADRLANAGYDLILVARDEKRLGALASRLSVDTGRHIQTLVADLTKAPEIAAIEDVLHSNTRIEVFVNNAGIGAAAPLLASDVNAMEKMIALNVSAFTRLIYAIAPAFASRGHGTIINISSISAIYPEILNGVYGGTKAFVLALTQSLHHELGSKGVKVQAVLPGAIATEFWNAAGAPVETLPKGIVMTASNLVDAALSGLEQGEVVTVPSLPEKADWDAFENARNAMKPNLSREHPASRYNVTAKSA